MSGKQRAYEKAKGKESLEGRDIIKVGHSGTNGSSKRIQDPTKCETRQPIIGVF